MSLITDPRVPLRSLHRFFIGGEWVINAATGELIRQLTLDPTKDYQPRGLPCGRPKKNPNPKRGFGAIPMS